VRLLRGRVVVREIQTVSSRLWTPDPNERETKTHRGIVLAKGPPALTRKGHEVPHGFEIGDVVQFHYVHLKELSINEWIDGKPANWMPQNCIDAVIEPSEPVN
jgi:co-chaperonin GroES (HSP10)